MSIFTCHNREKNEINIHTLIEIGNAKNAKTIFIFILRSIQNNIIHDAAQCLHESCLRLQEKSVYVEMPQFLLDPRDKYWRKYLLTFC